MNVRTATTPIIACILLVLYLTVPAQAGNFLIGTINRVVDGDTLVVRLDGQDTKLRLIGVDTPKTVHPNKPVEFFGREASAFTYSMASRRPFPILEGVGASDGLSVHGLH